MATLDAEFQKRSAAHWRDAFARHQLSADAIERYDFPAADEGARRDGYVLELERPGLGRVRTLGFPILLSESPARLDRTAPCVGQHTRELLREWLGVSQERIDALREAGVLR
jgi:crotonobetainyl-CoA:carnitine CoA-transferase CaiB-like acyl-CoA transferase